MASGAGATGRRKPPDFVHVEKYPFSARAVKTVERVEKVLRLPYWHWSHDQGEEGSCVGHGVSMERSITNTGQNILTHLTNPGRRYNTIWLWNEAKLIDVWPDTNPGDDNGTSVRAAYDVLRLQGHRRVQAMKLDAQYHPYPVGESPNADLLAGVNSNLWATSVDEIRTAISEKFPVAIGVDWYTGFDAQQLVQRGTEWFLRTQAQGWGPLRGGHCICIYGASDSREAFKVKNSWGRGYPLAWLPYSTMGALLAADGEACVGISDR